MKKIFNFILKLFGKGKPIVPVLRFEGIIGTGGGIGKGKINAENLETNIKKAFSESNPSAVAIIINSPGGSPVQSSLIYQRVRYLADKKDVPVLVFIEDVAASGGYWLSCVGDEIFADKSSIVGSIGVISASFGFTEAINKLGVERRVYTTGKSKGSLDPFKPEKKEDIQRLKIIQEQIHENFISYVKDRRGSKLNKKFEKEIFSGLFWVGKKAITLGLADGLGSIDDVLKTKYGKKIEIKIIDQKKSFIQRKLSSAYPSSLLNTEELINSIEEKALWSRYGL